jgi:hypothetical protein
MDLLDIFDMTKKFEKVVVPGSQTQGHVQIANEELFHDPFNIKKHIKGRDYARHYQLQEEREVAEVSFMWECFCVFFYFSLNLFLSCFIYTNFLATPF